MSSHNYSEDCPKCNGKNTLMCYAESRCNYVSGECTNCGYYYYTEEKYMSLEELNESRKSYGDGDLKPLTKKQFDKIKKGIEQ